MQVTRKIAAAAAVATVATLGLATVVSANMVDHSSATSGLANAASLASKKDGYGGHGDKQWYWVQKDGGLLSIADNNVGPFQACNNNVPVNVAGVQAPLSDVVGIVGLGQNGNSATAVKTCDLNSEQSNGRGGKWYRVGNDGLLSVSRNNVGPFQVCNNNVPVNVLGVQVPVSDLSGILGVGQNGNSVDQLKACNLESEQSNN